MKIDEIFAKGRMVAGTGGGLADAVPAEITTPEGETKAPAALSEGEFVVPADVVSMLGDGSSEAGSRILQQMIEEIRVAKTSSKKQAEPI